MVFVLSSLLAAPSSLVDSPTLEVTETKKKSEKDNSLTTTHRMATKNRVFENISVINQKLVDYDFVSIWQLSQI